MNKRELKKQFPWLTKGELDYEIKSNKYKTEQGFIKHLASENEKNARIFGKGDVSSIEIDITWRKSTYGWCPRAKWRAWFKDGSYESGETFAGGYGYDKHSQAVANVFNVVCKGMAWRKRNSRKKAPYGIQHVGAGADKNWNPYFEGGIGIGCYRSIAAYLGGKMESKSGETWDYHEFTFK